jgi:hypothetical protein
MKNIFKNGFSIDETKFSISVLMLIVAFGFGVYSDVTTGKINDGLMELIKLFAYNVFGLNVANAVQNMVTKKYSVNDVINAVKEELPKIMTQPQNTETIIKEVEEVAKKVLVKVDEDYR